MKLFNFLLFILLFTELGFAQSIYSDALDLRKLNPVPNESGILQFDLINSNDANKILGKYVEGGVTPLEIFNSFSGNPFLRAYNDASASILDGISRDKLSNLRGFNVTIFADGLAQFLVERASQELDVAFFNKFKNFLLKNPEAKILFPSTTDYISSFSPHEYTLFIVSLRESFYNDLKNLIYNVDDVLLLPKYVELIDKNPEIIISINCIQLIVDLEEGTHPVEIIEKLMNLSAWTDTSILIKEKPALKNLHNGLKTSYILANSVRSGGHGSTSKWISLQDFRTNILKDNTTFRIFLGLVYQRANQEKIEFIFRKSKSDTSDTVKSFAQYLTDNKDRLIVFQSLFLEMIQKGSLVDQSIAGIDPKNKPSKEDYYKFINSSIDVIEFGFKVSTLLANHEVENKYETYITLAKQGNSLYRNVYEKQFSAAILNASSIFELTFSEIYVNGSKENRKALEVTQDILRYGTFMANVIEADEPSQVKAAIEAAVLPVGSSTVKKYYARNFSINAYLGAQFRKKAEVVQQSWDASVGFTAPVGFAYTLRSMGRDGSVSLFVPLIDVGSVAQFRLSDDKLKIEEDISLGNIFSPGGYLVYGMAWDLPISIGAGGQYGPGLVAFDAATPNVINPSWRWNVFLAVDIPLFNLSKGKRRKGI